MNPLFRIDSTENYIDQTETIPNDEKSTELITFFINEAPNGSCLSFTTDFFTSSNVIILHKGPLGQFNQEGLHYHQMRWWEAAGVTLPENPDNSCSSIKQLILQRLSTISARTFRLTYGENPRITFTLRPL